MTKAGQFELPIGRLSTVPVRVKTNAGRRQHMKEAGKEISVVELRRRPDHPGRTSLYEREIRNRYRKKDLLRQRCQPTAIDSDQYTVDQFAAAIFQPQSPITG